MNLEQDEYFICPYCGESNLLLVDLTGGIKQGFVVDCEVCCAPIVIRLTIRAGEIVSMEVRQENE